VLLTNLFRSGPACDRDSGKDVVNKNALFSCSARHVMCWHPPLFKPCSPKIARMLGIQYYIVSRPSHVDCVPSVISGMSVNESHNRSITPLTPSIYRGMHFIKKNMKLQLKYSKVNRNSTLCHNKQEVTVPLLFILLCILV
jgi:hypothetical protein